MSGLEKMIAKMNELPQWEKISRRDNEFGEVILFYYNRTKKANKNRKK